MIFYNSKKRGFTLVELLFVVSIIGLMSSMMLSSFESAKAKSRDTRRLEDVRQIQAALAFYYNDYGIYPGELTSPPAGAPGYDSCISNDGNYDDISTILSPYMANVPIPPPSSNVAVSTQCYFYVVANNKQGYYILMSPEDQSPTGLKSKDDTRCPQSASNYFVSCANTSAAVDN